MMLNEHTPEWRGMVDKDTLAMHHTSRCVFGQVFGDFNEGIDVLSLHGCDEPQRYGLDLDVRNDVMYPVLDTAWRIVLDHLDARSA
ncbi:hypothetical protein ACIBCT_35325 [Streptosporangium sp. NPDC050855]|uniref:hypothetical protein n=1 Tax=Streptosporangium sp. NPDC050855 TaxID=3366194 RepID=UPI00379FA332